MDGDDGSKKDVASRLRLLQQRAQQGKAQNRKELYAEDGRLKHDAKEAKRLESKRIDAEEKLARLDAEDAGEDFDRKRAWDSTIEDAEEDDQQREAKARAQEERGLVDHGTEAARQYDRDMARFRPDVRRYARVKRAEARGDSVPTADGTRSKDVDRLVTHMSKVDAARHKSRQQRDRRSGNDGTYINDHNRRFNDHVSRAYDRYTEEIRDSFDRAARQ